jgi:hypothetical protein
VASACDAAYPPAQLFPAAFKMRTLLPWQWTRRVPNRGGGRASGVLLGNRLKMINKMITRAQ